MDFFLLNKMPARIGVVESTVAMDDDVAQLKLYAHAFANAGPKSILSWVRQAVSAGRKSTLRVHSRDKSNRRAPLARWFPNREAGLERLIAKAKRKPIQAYLFLCLDLVRSGRPVLTHAVRLQSPTLASRARINWTFCIVQFDRSSS